MPSCRLRSPHVALGSIVTAILLLCVALVPGRAHAQSGLGRDAASRPDTLAVTPVESPVSVADAAARAGVGPALVRVEELFGERLGTSLAATRKFTMVARSKLDAVLAEQAFAASGFVDARDPSAAKAMQVAGVRWLAVPRVVDFEDAVRTRRFAGLDREVSRRTIRLAVSVDVLDSTSGVVGETATVTVEATDTADEDTRARPEGSDPTSRLIDQLASDAAVQVACRLLDVAYPATVVAANGSVVTINRGTGGCLDADQIWIATRRGEVIVDPDTGDVLGFDEADTGAVRITRVEARLARATVLAGSVGRDDVLRPLPEGVSIENLAFDGDAVGGGGSGVSPSARPGRDERGGVADVRQELASLGPVAVVVTGSGIDDDVRRTIQTEVVGATGAIGLRAVAPDDVVVGDDTDASMLRLAEAIGAKWMLVVAIGSADARTADAVVGQDRFRAVERSVRGSWRLVAVSDAAAIAGDVFDGSARTMIGSGGSEVSVDVTRPLDREAASEAAKNVARGIAAAAASIAVAADGALTAADEGHLRVETVLDGLGVPDITSGPDGTWIVQSTQLALVAGGAEVAIDGFVLGSSPCTVSATVGPHRLRITRQGVETWDRPIRVLGRPDSDPQVVTVGLRPTDDARARFLENAAVLQTLEAGRTLTEAQAEAIRSFGEFLRQSGYRVDVRQNEDVRIDSDQVPETLQWNSYWSRW
jgi:curli biogenesis system outer membrane secretion channel CsgG